MEPKISIHLMGQSAGTKNFYITDDNVEEHVLGIAGFIKRQQELSRRKGYVIGMSGGIDCAVVARLCQIADVDTLLVLLPDGDEMETSKSRDHSYELINKFGFDHKEFSIGGITSAVHKTLAMYDLQRLPVENIPPRIRMTVLYTIAQQIGFGVAGTGNFSERLTGYFTKWGDGASDMDPLGLLTKAEVYTLARYLDIPESIINKAPSAGLYGDVTDEDDLGFTYDQLESFIMNGSSGSYNTDTKILHRIEISQHKINPIPMYTR